MASKYAKANVPQNVREHFLIIESDVEYQNSFKISKEEDDTPKSHSQQNVIQEEAEDDEEEEESKGHQNFSRAV